MLDAYLSSTIKHQSTIVDDFFVDACHEKHQFDDWFPHCCWSLSPPSWLVNIDPYQFDDCNQRGSHGNPSLDKGEISPANRTVTKISSGTIWVCRHGGTPLTIQVHKHYRETHQRLRGTSFVDNPMISSGTINGVCAIGDPKVVVGILPEMVGL